MALLPMVEYHHHQSGESITMRIPDDIEPFAFLAWVEKKHMGITDEMLAKSRADDLALAQQMAKWKKR